MVFNSCVVYSRLKMLMLETYETKDDTEVNYFC